MPCLACICSQTLEEKASHPLGNELPSRILRIHHVRLQPKSTHETTTAASIEFFQQCSMHYNDPITNPPVLPFSRLSLAQYCPGCLIVLRAGLLHSRARCYFTSRVSSPRGEVDWLFWGSMLQRSCDSHGLFRRDLHVLYSGN